jgi:3-isopropylmalate/(R)-2-methylmalate dehydratase small subunit
MMPFIQVEGAAIPMPMENVNTDQIIPSKYLKDLDADLAEGFLAFQRRKPDGQINAEFVLQRPQFEKAPILVVGANFGCGSSREHAVWAMQAFGVRCVIGYQLAEFFIENCLKNGVLPIELEFDEHHLFMQRVVQADGLLPVNVDLLSCQIRGPGDWLCDFKIGEHQRRMLLEGLDEIDMSLKKISSIERWEKSHQFG